MEKNLCELAGVIVLLPLAAFVVQVFIGKRLLRQGDWLPTGAMAIALAIASYMFFGKFLGSPEGVEKQVWKPLEGWLAVGGSAPGAGFRADFGIQVDNLTIVMLFVVTLVSFLVHLYSWGYMHGEERYNRFFAYLALFTFSMLGLCVSSNLLFMFIFWELVGVCSYFLIGFYFERKSAADAAMKAFITTRIGDVGFFLAILIIGSKVGSLEFDAIFKSVQAHEWAGSAGLLTFAGICLFAGAAGKSAQFPLHVWLPDAMEGPTPVSALIHAATMVAAGVYLIGRMFPFMAGAGYFGGDFWSSIPLQVVAVTGAFTAFFAATIAFAQTDIKKVLAYSTVSQLGYMMLGLGVGSVSAGLFHLTTHAFFKALLFLGAGSVIHAVHSNEMKDMGGLRRKMPITFSTFLIGTLAIAGLPLLSGFYSKEAILTGALAAAQTKGGVFWIPFILGITTALMTAFYMFRLFIKTFLGEPRNLHAYQHAHESPPVMTAPLIILAAFSVVGGGLWGLFGISHDWFEKRIGTAMVGGLPEAVLDLEPYKSMEKAAGPAAHLVLALSIAVFTAGFVAALIFFSPRSPLSKRELIRRGTVLGALHTAVINLWWVDRFYQWAFVGLVLSVRTAAGWFDKNVIDRLVNFQATICMAITRAVGVFDARGVDGAVRGIGEATLLGGRKMRRLQTGQIGQYVYASVFLMAGVLAVSAWMIWVNRR